MKEVLFWFKLLFVRSFEGIEKLIKNFDFSEDQSWTVVDMFEQKVKNFINSYKPNLDELLTLLNAIPKDRENCAYSFRLTMALGNLIGEVFIKELETFTNYNQCSDRLGYVMERTEGYIIRPYYFNLALVKLGELSGGAYQDILDKFESDVLSLIEDPEVIKMATAPISSSSKLS